MMLKSHFINMFKYNNWAAVVAAKSVGEARNNQQRVYDLLAHIVNSQMIWFNRIQQNDIAINPWEPHSTEKCVHLSSEITMKWINFLESAEDSALNRQMKYKNNKGEDWENTIGDVVTHALNHSTYHRAQIAQLMRQSGDQPPKTDYIAYCREFRK